MGTPTPFPIGPFLWLLVAVMSLTFYMALDGYDLGVGILMLTERDPTRHREMMEIIATAWDGNESWFVLLGIALFAGFPLAYSIILPAFYVPFILMLLSLVFRGMSLEFQSHSAAYERKFALAFSLGSLVAAFCQGLMVGAFVTGSLLSILAGFVGVSEGEVCLNGGRDKSRPYAESRSVRVAWIGQRPYLFPGTLAENIALGRPQASRQEIEAAAAEARVMDFAATLPSGLDTVIGERGLGISGGEAQRVALARAFLHNAPFLILDEPTAHLDADTEAALVETIATLAQGKTLVLATHSLALLALCERVLFLDEGRLVQPSSTGSTLPVEPPATWPEEVLHA